MTRNYYKKHSRECKVEPNELVDETKGATSIRIWTLRNWSSYKTECFPYANALFGFETWKAFPMEFHEKRATRRVVCWLVGGWHGMSSSSSTSSVMEDHLTGIFERISNRNYLLFVIKRIYKVYLIYTFKLHNLRLTCKEKEKVG